MWSQRSYTWRRMPRRGWTRCGDSAAIAASAWNGMLVARMVMPDSASARRMVVAALAVLRDGRPLPRAWLC